ncbi:MAG: M28 family peptidase, partial [Myxococcales bacterium]|nr:M28 family peptidase [Myxococcales bacterium]
DTAAPADTATPADTAEADTIAPDTADTALPLDTVLGPLTCGAESAAAVAGCVDEAAIAADVAAVAVARPAGSAGWQSVQDLCADRLASLGFSVARDDWGGGVNVIGTRAGESEPDVSVVLGASYDTTPRLDEFGRACRGADGNASGVAGLLEAARVLATRDTARTLVVACWDGGGNEQTGARAWATAAAKAGRELALVVDLHAIGFASAAFDSQTIPESWRGSFASTAQAIEDGGSRGDFVAAFGNELAAGPTARVADYAALSERAVHTFALPRDLATSRDAAWAEREGSHAPFWDRRYPALLLTDTASLRNPDYDCAHGLDTGSTLDPAFMKVVVESAVGVVGEALDATGNAPTAGLSDTCDLLAQDCDDGERCTLIATNLPAACEPVHDGVALGGTCNHPSDLVGDDTCGPGLRCASWGLGGDGLLPPEQCLSWCDAATDCGAGEACHVVDRLPDHGVCSPTCDPFAVGGCGEFQVCATSHDMAHPGWAFFCSPATAFLGAEGGGCYLHEDCRDGLGCHAGVCQPWCDADHPCPDDRACDPVMDGVSVPGLGTCAPG